MGFYYVEHTVLVLIYIDSLDILILLLLVSAHHFAEILRNEHEPTLIGLIHLLIANSRKNL